MRTLCYGAAALVLALGLAAPAAAQDSAQPLLIQDVRVGFPQGDEDFFKAGTWVPIVVQIKKQILEEFKGELVVEAADADGVLTRFTPKVVAIPKEGTVVAELSYIKVSNGSSKLVTVTLNGKVGTIKVEATFRYPDDVRKERRGDTLLPSQRLVLGLGQARGLEPAALQPEPGPNGEAPAATGSTLEKLWRVAGQTDLGLLPNLWFGYEALDVVVLATGGTWNGSMAQALANDEGRLRALLQWVEMGGHLVVSVGRNRNSVAGSRALASVLPVTIDPNRPVPEDTLEGVRALIDQRVPNNRRSTGRAEVKPFAAELTRLTPRGTAQPIVFEKRHKLPAVVQGTYGLGRITVVGFDTDEGRFATWDNRRDFWYALLDLREPNPGQNVRQMNPWETPTDLASRLAEQLESFGDVQVISFGWVALFILVYIIIVGPLDYLFLKKVVKRLEWTWVTFPAVVLVVSLGAYFLAHYLKGDELRINKLDLVEVDAQRGQVYGTSWFTVFSPRLQHYQVGITPSGVTAAPDTVNVSWMGRPGYNSRSLGRGQGPGLFTRSYDYDKNGELLKGVPIQVWSMKSLTARWSVKADPTPPLAATLTEGTGLSPIRGNLTSNLNQPLIQCKLLYRGDVWNVGRLEKGQPVVVRSEQKLTTQEGLQGSWGYTGVMARNPRQSRYDYNFGTQRGPENLHDLVKQLMFYRRLPHDQRQQSEYLDFADQTWRLDTFPSEAILIGIVEDANGASAAINDAGRLGCKLAPFEPELRGTLTQSTVVRAYFPVAPRAGDEAAPDK